MGRRRATCFQPSQSKRCIHMCNVTMHGNHLIVICFKQLRFSTLCQANTATNQHRGSTTTSILRQQSTQFMLKRQLIKHTAPCTLGCSMVSRDIHFASGFRDGQSTNKTQSVYNLSCTIFMRSKHWREERSNVSLPRRYRRSNSHAAAPVSLSQAHSCHSGQDVSLSPEMTI